jgi:hypothetical protein
MGIRKNYRNLTDAERERFVQALFHVKSTGLVDQFAEIHERHFFHTIHRSSHFLPWHREMLLRFERALQEHHPDVTIPYWDSTVDRSPSDPLWANSFIGQFNSAWGLRRALGSATLSTLQEVQTNQGRGTYDAFWPELERVIHNPPHGWVGGVMAGVASPGDPVFYLHHCWIDLLWAQWQLAHPGAPFVSSGAGVGLNDPLMEWPDRTPADVLDHRALGYAYDIEVQLVVANFGYDANAGGWRVEQHPRFLADLTGDGRADIVGFGEAGVWVALNNGNGTFQAPQLRLPNAFGHDANAGGWRVEQHPRFLADLTGDGRADIVGFGEAGVWVSTLPAVL